MRLSTSTIYQSGLNGILRNESDVLALQQQISSGRRVVTPSDDPLAAGKAITAYQNLNITQTYASNREAANRSLGLESNALGSIVTTLTDVLTRVVQAGNGTMADEDRNSLATVLEQSRDALLALANSTDGNGQYLFSGTTGDAAAYVQDPNSGIISYNGSAGQRLVQVEQARQMAVSDIGTDIFARATPGTTEYIATAQPTNKGTVTFSSPSIVPGNASAGHNFQITFKTDATTGAMTYSVEDTTTNTVVQSDVPYESGAEIDLGAAKLALKGDPADGDTLTVTTAQSTGLDMFHTLNSLITTLRAPSDGNAAAQAQLTNMLATANKKLSINLDNVSTVQASVGARQNELDALDTMGSQRALTDNKTLTDLTKIDYYEAVSAMSMHQLALQASMAAFSAVKGTSLFSMNK
ncbi:flagellar hook-associated protein 3 [Bordetella genomosp. 9]|uniref:Flagellar hook-associated protein 3 n=1 Tax=Bordetella genomosp. 9 TaxID=1416803 RepID=A0A1W6Z7B5_9BORD|nr:flagellar hook-associated protein 3 [Bordetella genomosp. 9]ARP92680.1 flagellar hook-associated protein 3 [Bordetella genomosp. 9]